MRSRSAGRNCGELVAGMEVVLPAVLGQHVLPGLRIVHLLDHGDNAISLLGRDSGGATMPRQLASSTSTPCSCSVGAIGAARRRRPPGVASPPAVEPEMASARSSPEAIWSCHSPRPETPAETWPPRIAASASPPPEYGT